MACVIEPKTKQFHAHPKRLSRLGVPAEILTKVGDDAYGKMITDELSQEGLGTARVVRKPGIISPFTYVIVDTAGQTRTCIHTPSEGKWWCWCLLTRECRGVDVLS